MSFHDKINIVAAFYFSGLRSKLNYVASLGVQAIWLSPVFKSPMVDFGYDISDFKDVDPLFGSLPDMKELIKEMHELGNKIAKI